MLIRKFYRTISKFSDSRNRLVVLLYHKVSNVNAELSLNISAELYEQHLIFYKNNFKIFRSVDQWLTEEGSGLMITFDDGYFNNLNVVLPLHERLDIPFSVFTTTHWLDQNGLFWWDEAELLLNQLNNGLSKDLIIRQIMELDSIEAKYKYINTNLPGKLNYLAEDYRPLSNNELIELSRHPLVEIGSHTVSHPRLSLLGYANQKKEIEKSKCHLEILLNSKVNLFSYPHGGREAFNAESKMIVQNVGYKYAFAAYSGIVKTQFDPFEIPRVHIGELSVEELQKKLRSFL